MDAEVAEERLVALDAATSLADLSPLKSIGPHKLAGARKDLSSPYSGVFRASPAPLEQVLRYLNKG